MIDEYQHYFEYLKKRSRLGLWYRKYWLYPTICKHLRGRSLDVGCGIGDMLRFRADTIGVDINPETVAFCQNQGLDVRKMDTDLLPFPDQEFDSVILDNVLEHIQNPSPLLKEIYRVLRPGGKVIIGVPGRKGFTSDPDHKMFYDQSGLIDTVERSSFRLNRTLFTPFRSNWLDRNLSQYCIYGVFNRD